MLVGGRSLGWVSAVVAVAVAVAAPVPVAASDSEPASEPASASASASAKELVLVAPVQGSQALRSELGDRVESSVRVALRDLGYTVTVEQEALGRAVVVCQTPECSEQALKAAGVAFAIVPAVWSRESGGWELALTLVQSSSRNLNATGVIEGELPSTAVSLVYELLAQRATVGLEATSVAPSDSEPARPHAWKAGPIILIAGGAAAFVSIGVAAGTKNDTQQLNTSAVAAWSAVGAAAIAGGITWWVVGAKRRRERPATATTPSPTLAFRPTGIDLRLRF